MIDDKKFIAAKEKAAAAYKDIGQIKCPYLNDFVHFNAAGFEHILFKAWDRPRSREDQYIRLCLLPLAVKVISRSHTLQEYKQCRRFERFQSNSKWKQEMKTVKYYGFTAIINNALIKVIVKEIEGRNKNFHSIIPKWRNEITNGSSNKKLYKGNPEED